MDPSPESRERGGEGESPEARCPRCDRIWTEDLARCGWCGALSHAARCERHPEALAANACAVCGRVVCAACDRGDRHVSLCDEHQAVAVVQGWAQAFQSSEDAEAQLVTDALRAAGLDAHVLSQKDHAHMISVGGMAVVRVLVPAAQHEAAVAALASMDRREG